MKKIFDYTLAILAFVFTLSISQTESAKEDN